MNTKKIMIGGILLLLILFASIIYSQSVHPASVGTARRLPVYNVETEEKVVAITFDSAWGDEDFDEVLRILREHEAKAAFFMTGGFVSAYPETVKKLLEEGHEIGNHGDNHKEMSQLSLEECEEEILGMHTKVKNLTGQDMWLFRPPYGDYNDTVLKAAENCDYMSVQWSVDSLDWKDYGKDDIVSRVTSHKNLKKGAVILLHTGTKYTVQALPELLVKLKEQGYRFAALKDLILRENYIIDHEGCQKQK